ncbi:U3 small nucleolar RNA-associated protein 4 homolog [Haliotis rufescens]|uniref:U3 small nucleolar RNA-associated protein 4 homolog n=1 Tax=Haliotis rufescens TaxID=6454 RepID=UPI001EAFB2EB|nr:U3 small nucleolar RNA-associated protein 4 homolog [Haliotis rufescens]
MGEFRVHHVRFFEYKPKAIHCLAYTKESKRLAVSRSDGSLEIWSEQDKWFQERVIPGSGDRSIEAVIWQGRRLFTAGLDGEVTEYDLIKLQPMHSAFSHAGPIWCLTQNSSGTRLAAGTEDGCVVLFDIDMDNLQYLKSFDKQEGRILSIAWHEGENTIVTGGVDNIRLWSASSGHAIQRLTIGREEVSKETIVWCVTVTSDLTVISGDSRGKTCFWNGKMGTLLRSFQSHKADVLSLCLSEAEESLYTVGVDPTIVQFEKVIYPGENNPGKWTRSVVRSSHTHDIRAIVLSGDTIITGGVDTNLVLHDINPAKGKGRKVPGLPQRPLVSVAKAAGLLLLQYPTWLEVWRLGATKRNSNLHGEILPLDTKPLKLVQLKAKIGECVVCSAIAADGALIGYSDERSIRLYTFTVNESEDLQPVVTLTRIKVIDEDIMPAHLMTFNIHKQLITASCSAAVQVIDVKDTEVKVIHTFQPLKDVDSIHLLSVSADGDHVAVADHKMRVRVYNITTKQLYNLPSQKTQPCAMTFSAESKQLCVVHCDNTILEYNVNKSELTQWSRSHSRSLPGHWRNRKNIITQISPNPRNPQHYFLHDDEVFCILDKSKPMAVPGKKMKRHKDKHIDTSDTAFTYCSKYKYLLYMEPVSEDWLVAVERTPVAVTDTLPATLRQKKFGT